MSGDSEDGELVPEMSPELKSFIDHVVVPALVDRFLDEGRKGISSPVVTPGEGNPPKHTAARSDGERGRG